MLLMKYGVIMKFDQLYNRIISEGRKPFRGARDLPSKYLENLPNVKCTLDQHFLDRYYQRFDIKLVQPDIIYRNVQLFLEKIFNDKGCVQLIDFNEDQNDPMQFYCSTVEQFNGRKGSHLCVIIKINSRTKENGKKEYYCLLTTVYVDSAQEYDQLIKNGYLSTKHQDQIPITIIGQNFEKIFNKKASI